MRPQPVDLLYVCDRYPERTQTFVVDEVREMAARGLIVKVVHLREPTDAYSGDAIPGIHVPEVHGRSGSRLARSTAMSFVRRPRGTVRAARHTFETQRIGRTDELQTALDVVGTLGTRRIRRVHAHFAWSSAGVALVVAKLLSVPFSMTVHGNDLYARRDDVERKLRDAHRVITVCDYFRRELERIDPACSVDVVPVPVDAARFRRERPWRQDPFRIVNVSRLVEKKGLADLIEAVGILRRSGRELTCVIGGSGPERDQLMEQVRSLGLADVVTLVGSLPHDDVRHLIESASILVAPFVVAANGDRDSQPLSLKEAMALEVPVVSTTEVGVPELVDEHVGRLVPPHDPSSLARAIAELQDLPAKQLQEMGRAGRARILDAHVPEVTIPRLMSLLELGLPHA